MKGYLDSLIVEQISRALSLKKLIPHPLRFSTLSGLGERCTNILDQQISILNALKVELSSRDENDIRDILRMARLCVWDISHVEYYGIPALYYQTDEVGFLNDIIFKIHQEIKPPFNHPSVCCTSNKYYFSFQFTNTIFVPLGESDFLLHLPDLYHELGHYVLGHMDKELRLKPIKESYEHALTVITDHYNRMLKMKKREAGPKEVPFSIEHIHSQWKYWLEEFFSDLFALYTVGPAYAWSHLHLTMKTSVDIHYLSVLSKQSHPSDEARMRILLEGLKMLGFNDEAEKIKEKWKKVSEFWGRPSPLYQYAYQSALLNELVKSTFDALRQSGFSLATPENLSAKKEGNEIRILLNEAWDRFWRKSGEEFRQWEEDQIATLKQYSKAKSLAK